jgi:tetratricopeptide (TPR) repeat protein
VEHRATPTHDVFSYTATDHQWIELRWLYCVLAHLGWQLGGPTFLILAKTMIIAAAFFIIAWPVRSILTTLPGVLVLTLGVCSASSRFLVRPEVATTLFVCAFLTVLDGFARGRFRRLIWGLPLLQIVWVNSHTLFVFGPLLVALYAAGDTIRRLVSRFARRRSRKPLRPPEPLLNTRLALLAALVVAACWINPYGHRGALFPFLLAQEIQDQHLLGKTIKELLSPLAVGSWTWDFHVAAGLAALSALSFAWNLRRTDPARLIIWAAHLALAATAIRNVGLFSFVATWATLRNLQDSLPPHAKAAFPLRLPARAKTAAHAVLFCSLVFSAWYAASDRLERRTKSPRSFGFGIVDQRFPIAATNFILENNAQPQLFHALGDGSYLIWAARHRFPVYVDGRLEVYGEAFIRDYYAVLNSDWENFADGLGINTAMIQQGHLVPLIPPLVASPDWVLVHVDPGEMVFVRDIPDHADLIRKHRIDLNRPWIPRQPLPVETVTGWRRWIGAIGRPWYSLGMAQQFLMLGSIDNAAVSLQRGLEDFPTHEKMRLTLSLIHRSQGRADQANRLVEGLDLSPETSLWADRVLADLCMKQGWPAEAIEPLKRAARAQPGNAEIHAALGDAFRDAGQPQMAAAGYWAALELKPKVPSYWVQLGRACERLGQRDEAIGAYVNAVRYKPSLYKVHTRLGILLAGRGDRAAAAACFAEALRIKHDYPPAREQLDRLSPP